MASRHSALIAVAIAAVVQASATPTDWLAQSRAAMAKGDFIGAGDAAARAVAEHPHDPDALLTMGNLVRDRYGLAAALPWYDRGLGERADHIDLHIDRASTLGDMGRARECLAETRTILALDPNNHHALYMQGVIAARAGNWDLARRILYRIGHRMDGVPGVAMVRAAAEMNGGSNEAAIAGLSALLVQQPGNAAARRLLALAQWHAHDMDAVVTTLRPLADRADADVWTLALTGRALEATGDRAQAAE